MNEKQPHRIPTRLPTPNARRGRPTRSLPDPIPDTPENVAKALLASPPKSLKDWKFLQRKGTTPA